MSDRIKYSPPEVQKRPKKVVLGSPDNTQGLNFETIPMITQVNPSDIGSIGKVSTTIPHFVEQADLMLTLHEARNNNQFPVGKISRAVIKIPITALRFLDTQTTIDQNSVLPNIMKAKACANLGAHEEAEKRYKVAREIIDTHTT